MRHLIQTVLAAVTAAMISACSPTSTEPDSLAAGDWVGELSPTGQSFGFALHIAEEDGALSGTIDYPQRGRWDWTLEDIALDGETLTFRMPLNGDGLIAAASATWNAETETWTGEVTGAGQRIPISFSAGTAEPFPTVEGLDGRWEGEMDVGGAQPLTLVFRIMTDEHGTIALMDSPDQMATNIPVNTPVIEGDKVTLTVEQALGTYVGTRAEDGQSMTGEWVQMGQRFPLDLARSDIVEGTSDKPNRPQEPTEPYPYTAEDVTFENAEAGVTLAGALTIPKGAGPFPAAILVSGSGAQDRNEELMGHKPFLVIADHLTRNGIAVLRYDDRGVGGSGGVHQDSSLADITSDIEAAYAYLQTRNDIDHTRTGLIGHSEGGMTTPLAAVRNPAIAFVVMLAGPAVNGRDLLKEQQRLISEVAGAPQMAITRNQAAVDAVADAATPEEAAAEVRKVFVGMPDEVIEAVVQQFAQPYIYEFVHYDPAPVLEQLKTPVLAINGSKDLQVSAEQNLPALREIFADHPDATVVELEDLNHLFQHADTGSPTEYQEIEETFAPEALDLITVWIKSRIGG